MECKFILINIPSDVEVKSYHLLTTRTLIREMSTHDKKYQDEYANYSKQLVLYMTEHIRVSKPCEPSRPPNEHV
uniref:Uncharacterized protein n=1 Tax=Physcomitrium patens TaxID=3218 RepID=A0A2K1JDS9_PHYPA|nr:hypothetical protein PHYPA_019961 [Physcomitrium patens]